VLQKQSFPTQGLNLHESIRQSWLTFISHIYGCKILHDIIEKIHGIIQEKKHSITHPYAQFINTSIKTRETLCRRNRSNKNEDLCFLIRDLDAYRWLDLSIPIL